MKFACPHCGQHIEAESSWAGLMAQCPTCSGELQVPVSGLRPTTPPEQPEAVFAPPNGPKVFSIHSHPIGSLLALEMALQMAPKNLSGLDEHCPKDAKGALSGYVVGKGSSQVVVGIFYTGTPEEEEQLCSWLSGEYLPQHKFGQHPYDESLYSSKETENAFHASLTVIVAEQWYKKESADPVYHSSC
jgi:hypothetical protein